MRECFSCRSFINEGENWSEVFIGDEKPIILCSKCVAHFRKSQSSDKINDSTKENQYSVLLERIHKLEKERQWLAEQVVYHVQLHNNWEDKKRFKRGQLFIIAEHSVEEILNAARNATKNNQ